MIAMPSYTFTVLVLLAGHAGAAQSRSLTRTGGIDAHGKVDLSDNTSPPRAMTRRGASMLETGMTRGAGYTQGVLKELEDMAFSEAGKADPAKIKVIKDLVDKELIPDLKATRDAAAGQVQKNLDAISKCEDFTQTKVNERKAKTQKAVDDARQRHSTCRTGEKGKMDLKTSACNFLKAAASAAPKEQPPASGNEDDVLRYMKQMNEFYCPQGANIQQCTAAKKNATDAKQECDGLQIAFESGLCTWAVASVEACNDIATTCYDSANQVYTSHVAETKELVKTWKTEYATMLKISCYVDVWAGESAETQEVQRSKFNQCQKMNTDSSAMDIEYGTPADKYECPQPEKSSYPGSDGFASAEYSGFQDIVKDVLPCEGMKKAMQQQDVPGVQEEIYKFRQNGQFHSLTSRTPVKTRQVKNINYQVTRGFWPGTQELKLKDHFYVRWTGQIEIEKAGNYEFCTRSDDGSRLYINGKSVVQNPGWHGMRTRCGRTNLKTGKQQFWAEVFEGGGGAGMILYYKGADTGNRLKVIPENVLSFNGDAALQAVVQKLQNGPGITEAIYKFRQNGRFHGLSKKIPVKIRRVEMINYGATGGVWGGLQDLNLKDHFYVRWSGKIQIKQAGRYQFCTTSDDGSRMFISGRSVVQNPGWHGMRRRCGYISLNAGKNSFWAEMFEGGGGAGMILYYKGPDTSNQLRVMPKDAFVPVQAGFEGPHIVSWMLQKGYQSQAKNLCGVALDAALDAQHATGKASDYVSYKFSGSRHAKCGGACNGDKGVNMKCHYVGSSSSKSKLVGVNAFAKTYLYAESAKDVTLYLGSDDGIAVWLNGKSVFQNLKACRCYRDKQDSTKIRLNKGKNLLVVKIGERDGHMGFTAQLENTDGVVARAH